VRASPDEKGRGVNPSQIVKRVFGGSASCVARRASTIFAVKLGAGLMSVLLALTACSPPEEGNYHVPARVTAANLQSRYPAPDDWHRLALYGNWDFVDAAVWREIVTRPECDRATALLIFWKAQPDYFVAFPDRMAVPDINRDGYDLVHLIRKRWGEGKYPRANVAFDPEVDVPPVDLSMLRERLGERVDQLMPPAMREKLPGRRIQS
jgi:hypothetical protein